MNFDEYGEIINGEATFEVIGTLIKLKPVMIGWTDERGTHFDILFTYKALVHGANIQGGLKKDDLFVSIMRRTSFGFRSGDKTTHYSYYAEKLEFPSESVTVKKLAELINGIKKYL